MVNGKMELHSENHEKNLMSLKILIRIIMLMLINLVLTVEYH